MAHPDLFPFLFLQSLTGDALIWMTNLPVAETQSFRQVALTFINQFSHHIKVCPTIVEVTQEKMKTNEDFVDFANWVRDVATRAKFTIPQDEMIQMIINNAHGPLKSFLLMNEYTSFE